MNQPEKENLIERWLQGDLEEEELLRSISQEELDQYKAILNTVDNWVPEGSEGIKSQLKEIYSQKKEAKVVSISRRAWISGIASAITLTVAISVLFFQNQPAEYYAENENLEILLPDGSTTAVLSPGAKLSYDDFDQTNRKVSIVGRVYFDVTEKGAFEVSYEGGSVAVLGTQFEVVNYDGLFETTCFEGSVEVTYRGKRAKIQPRDRVVYVKGSLEKSQIAQNGPGWLGDEERFENDLLIKVVRVLEMRYKVQVEEGQVSMNRRFTGTIPVDDLEQACRKVFTTMGINYKIEGDKVILTR